MNIEIFYIIVILVLIGLLVKYSIKLSDVKELLSKEQKDYKNFMTNTADMLANKNSTISTQRNIITENISTIDELTEKVNRYISKVDKFKLKFKNSQKALEKAKLRGVKYGA